MFPIMHHLDALAAFDNLSKGQRLESAKFLVDSVPSEAKNDVTTILLGVCDTAKKAQFGGDSGSLLSLLPLPRSCLIGLFAGLIHMLQKRIHKSITFHKSGYMGSPPQSGTNGCVAVVQLGDKTTYTHSATFDVREMPNSRQRGITVLVSTQMYIHTYGLIRTRRLSMYKPVMARQ